MHKALDAVDLKGDKEMARLLPRVLIPELRDHPLRVKALHKVSGRH